MTDPGADYGWQVFPHFIPVQAGGQPGMPPHVVVSMANMAMTSMSSGLCDSTARMAVSIRANRLDRLATVRQKDY